MSTHDPFDGIYDDVSPAAGSGTHPAAAPAEASNPPIGASAGASPVPAAPTADLAGLTDSETYSRSHLSRMRKSELQALARSRGLDAKGDRDDLIETIFMAQRR